MQTTPATQRVVHSGTGGEFFVIFLVNFLLTLLTLGIYSFWAKARSRRYLWSHTSFDDEQFEYDGTGLESFLGFLKAIGIIVLLTAVIGGGGVFLLSIIPPLGMLVLALAYLFIVFVAPHAARYGAEKYKLSRTRYRGVRFARAGSALSYGFKTFGHSLLVLFTLGLYAPFMSMKMHKYRTERSFYGSESMQFDGVGRDVFGRFFAAWLLTIPTLGLIWIWYIAKVAKYKARHTRLGDLRFDSTFTGGQLMWLFFSNLLLVVFTLGLGAAWAAVRRLRFDARHTVVDGTLDYARIKQAAEKATATGEGFADALDVDFGI